MTSLLMYRHYHKDNDTTIDTKTIDNTHKQCYNKYNKGKEV